MKKIACLLLVLTIVSCKSTAKIAEAKATDALDVQAIINGIQANKIDFKTAVIRAGVGYESEDTGVNAGADIRIKKDEKILVSVKVLGYTLAKALITPDRVQYYQKTGDKYFDGDYTTLSRLAGTPLNYEKVQNLLLGKPLDDLTASDFIAALSGSNYELRTLATKPQASAYAFEAGNFFLKKTQIVRAEKNQSVTVDYNGYGNYDNVPFPLSVKILAKEADKFSKIEIEYKDVKINENVSFPYEVPSGYERIVLE
ncbi:DUF4292 domain-containing protein [Flavobacterium sp.]|uniref:DUF4292 domain-containing protein n=1 Tax=Flavobacterium sp. TaxID=239 RepID=UPI002624457B|nr:DUF4292 domain-containing protein [Flavobacterium sp.]